MRYRRRWVNNDQMCFLNEPLTPCRLSKTQMSNHTTPFTDTKYKPAMPISYNHNEVSNKLMRKRVGEKIMGKNTSFLPMWVEARSLIKRY